MSINFEYAKNENAKYIVEKYNVINAEKIDKNKPKNKSIIKINIFNGWLQGTWGSIRKTLDNYENLKIIVKDNNEEIIDTFIKNNRLWIRVKTIDEQIFATSLNGYKERQDGLNSLIRCIEEKNHKLLSSYINSHEKVLIDYNCGHPPRWVAANSYISSNAGCTVCSRKEVVRHVNDVYTSYTYMLDYFDNPEELIGVGIGDENKRLFKCPNCKQEKYDTITNVYTFGFSCPSCSDGISYPEKFISNILNQLNIKYFTQQSFDWCVFDYMGKKRFGRYDFYIPSMQLIIEADGGFHYEYGYKKTAEYTVGLDKIKDDLAEQNGLKVIRINCYYRHMVDRFGFIKENTIKELSPIFDLSNIDWEVVEKNNLKSKIIEVCDLWNEGLSTPEIKNIVHLCDDTIRQYLKQCNKINLCDFSRDESKRRTRKYHKELQDV